MNDGLLHFNGRVTLFSYSLHRTTTVNLASDPLGRVRLCCAAPRNFTSIPKINQSDNFNDQGSSVSRKTEKIRALKQPLESSPTNAEGAGRERGGVNS